MALFVHVAPDVRRAPVTVHRCLSRPPPPVARARTPDRRHLPAGVASARACARPPADVPGEQGSANGGEAGSDAGNPPGATASPTGDASAALTKRASGTLLGRVVVELLALIVGVMLLIFVAVWKGFNVVRLYAWRAVVWLASVRRLGRWACGRAVAVGRAMMQSPGRVGVVLSAVWAHALAGVAFAVEKTGALLAPVRAAVRRRTDGHVNVRSTRVVEDEQLVSKKELDDVQREIARMRDIIEQGVPGAKVREEMGSGDGAEGVAVANEAGVDAAKDDLHSEQRAGGSIHGEDDLEEVQTPRNSIAKANRRLILLRHAKSAWDRSGNADDHSRDLSSTGVREAELVGAELRKKGWMFDSIVCSNAKRTMKTLELLTPSRPEEQEEDQTVITESLYFAVSGDEMAKAILNEAPDGSLRAGSTTLVVCHSPGCEELVEGLTGVKPEMGTACAALLERSSDDSDSEERESDTSDEDCELAFGLKQWRLVDVVRPADLS